MQVEKYEYLPGMQQMLGALKAQGYEMHVVSNYPSWYRMIEDKLKVHELLPSHLSGGSCFACFFSLWLLLCFLSQ